MVSGLGVSAYRAMGSGVRPCSSISSALAVCARCSSTFSERCHSLLYLAFIGLVDGLKKAVAVAGEQVFSSSQNPQGIYFTANFQQKAKAWGLSEKDAADVYYHGQESKPGMKVRKYNGYELSIYYGQSKTTGQPYISTIWKRQRR